MKNIILVLVLFFVSCGYKPVSKISEDVLGDKIYVSIAVSLNDPKNSVLIKDSVLEAVVSRFDRKLVERQNANTLMHVKLNSINFSPIVYDKNGYVISYRTRVVLNILTNLKNGKKISYDASGEYDFNIEPNSIISDSKRFEAIKGSSLDALDEYVAFISIKGMLWQQR